MELPINITKYLDDLDNAGHERLLTAKLVPFHVGNGRTEGCLVGVARGMNASNVLEAVACSDWRDPKYALDYPAEKYIHEHLRMQRSVGNPFTGGLEAIHITFNRLAHADQAGTQQAIRDYIVQLRLQRGQTVAEPQMVGEAVPA